MSDYKDRQRAAREALRPRPVAPTPTRHNVPTGVLRYRANPAQVEALKQTGRVRPYDDQVEALRAAHQRKRGKRRR